MGLLVHIRDDRRITGVVVNIDGPFEPKIDNAYLLVFGPTGVPILVPAIWQDDEWVRLAPADMCGPMDSGKLADSSDSRWARAVRKLWARQAHERTGIDMHRLDWLATTVPTAVSVHDRFETWDTYDRMSR